MGRGLSRLGVENTQLPKTKVTKSFLIRIISYFIPYWKKLISVFVVISLSSILGLIPPILLKDIIDKALPSNDLKQLALLTVASLSITIVIGLIGVIENYLNTWISTHIIYDIKNAMYKHLEYMSLSFFTVVKPGEIITRMTMDIGGIQGIFNSIIINFIRNILVFLATTVALVSMNWKLALLGIFLVPFLALPTKKVGNFKWKIASQGQVKLQELNQIIQETLNISGSTLMKIFNRENCEYEKFKILNKEVTRLQNKESLVGRWFMMALNTFTTIGPMLIYFYGGYLLIKGEISVGAIVAFVAMLNRLYIPVIQLSNTHIDFRRSMALFERVFEYFDKKHEMEDELGAVCLKSSKGKVEFNNVTFSYNSISNALENVSFVSESGSMTAIVGPSGAGKTTIINLIPRLYDVNAGSIKLDGKDIKDITIDSLRSHIGMVMQDAYLFNVSIKENLLYANNNATEQELISACNAANIHEFIMSLSEGYNTVVGNRGIKLSGGERQRIAIARVLLKNPNILILDEATSALDSISESMIQSSMETLLKGRTSFVIAHRLSTIMAADMILVLENGHIVESGKHDELIDKGGLYKVLYDTQFNSCDCLKSFSQVI